MLLAAAATDMRECVSSFEALFRSGAAADLRAFSNQGTFFTADDCWALLGEACPLLEYFDCSLSCRPSPLMRNHTRHHARKTETSTQMFIAFVEGGRPGLARSSPGNARH
jgi:hypothetical protein